MIIAMQQAGIDPPDTLVDDGKLHRYAGPHDKPTNKKNWFILYPIENGLQAGAFGRWIGDSNGAVKWCNKDAHELTDEEKKEYKRRQEDLRRKQVEDRKLAAADCAARCQQLWTSAQPASDEHPYLVKKQVKAFGLKQMGDTLLVPIMSLRGELRGIQFISPDGSKVFKTGVDYAGAVHMIGKPVDNTLIITEGYATGSSIHMATGHAVLVAFVAGNLKAVAEAARAKQPSWDIIIAADNDQWAKEYDAACNVVEYHIVPCELNGGKRVNTGRVKAEEAAKAVKATCVLPFFRDESTHPTDFNDLHVLEGLDAVNRQVFPPPIAEYVPPAEYEGPELGEDGQEMFREHPLQSAPFVVLGHDRGEYYFMSHGTGQITALTPANITKANMLALAPLQWWEQHFEAKVGFNEDMAKNNLIQTCQGRGIYNSDRVRGLGAWEDKGRSVLHLGDVLVVDGQRFDPSHFKSEYIYERAISIADEKTPPLSNAEASKLIDLCDMLSWEKPVNGRLLAGWCVASIICGALKWRPHVWLTGPSSSGKSWCIHNIIKHISGQHLKGMLGSTSEAGLRNALRNDAFSVFFDEFEAEDKNAAARIQSILEFARPASCNEDSKIYKAKSGGGGVNSYQPRSCIGVASINVNMTQKADISRVSVLSLTKAKDDNHFKDNIMPYWSEQIRPPAYARGLRSRSISLITVINQNAEVFQEAATIQFKSRRSGDQYGTLLACAYSLCSSKLVTLEQAKEFVGRQDWSGHTLIDEQDDERQCLSAILESLINMGSGVTLSVAELLHDSHSLVDSNQQKEALERHGIKHVLGGFVIHNKHSAIKRMLEKTPWGGNWARIIERLPGAQKQTTHRFCGVVAKGTMLPITYVVGGE